MRTFIQCMEGYLDHCRNADLSPVTVTGKRSRLKAFVRWCFAEGITHPEGLNLVQLEAYQAHLYKEHTTRGGKSIDVVTRRNHLQDMVMFLRWLRRVGEISVDPSLDFTMPRVPRRVARVWLTPEEVEQVLDRADLYGPLGIRDRAILETFYATGIRRKELVSLDIGDVDLKSETLTVYHGKGEHERIIPIATRACRAIEKYLKEVRPGLATLTSGDALFLNNKGRRFRVPYMSYFVKQYVARSGVTKKGACNLYRHSTGTLMLNGGADLRYVQKMLGHADVSSTQVYTHVAIGPLKEVYNRSHPAARREVSDDS